MDAVRGPVAVRRSGGLDSTVLPVEMARAAGRAVPIAIRAGHPWEAAEGAALRAVLAALADPRIARPRRSACRCATSMATTGA